MAEDGSRDDEEIHGGLDDTDKEDMLISCVQKHSVIFDQGSQKYKNTAYKEEIWKSVALEVEWEVELCMKKWKTLRDTYIRKKRSLKGKSGQAAKRIKLWKHFGAMMFLDNFIVEKKDTTTNLRVTVPEADPEDEDPPSNFEHDDDDTLNLGPSANGDPEQVKVQDKYGKRKRRTSIDEFDKDLLDTIKKAAVMEDEHYHFGMQIADQMRRMDPMMSMLAKNRINQTMFDLMYPAAIVLATSD